MSGVQAKDVQATSGSRPGTLSVSATLMSIRATTSRPRTKSRGAETLVLPLGERQLRN